MIINTSKITIIILIFLFFFSTGNLSAQNNDELEVITFDDDGPSSSNQYNNLQTQLIIKSSPLSFLFGRQFIEVEYPLTNYFTVEGGVGFTFQPVISGYQNIYAELYYETITDFDCDSPNYDEGNNYCDQSDYSNYDIRNTNLGPWLSGAIKFYFYNDAPDEYYLSLNLKYHRDNYRVLQVEENINFIRSSDNYAKEYVNNLDYTVRAGYQTLFSPLTADLFVGIGIRNINQSRLDVGFDLGKDTWTNSFQQLSSTNILLESGVRIGFELLKNNPPEKSPNKKKKRRRRR